MSERRPLALVQLKYTKNFLFAEYYKLMSETLLSALGQLEEFLYAQNINEKMWAVAAAIHHISKLEIE